MKKSILIFLLFSSCLFSQNEEKQVVFLDGDQNIISQIDFDIKSKSNLYQIETSTKNGIIINQLIYKYEFGKLSNIELEQTKLLLKKQFQIDDFEKNIIVTYIDTLYGFEEYIKNIEARKLLDESSITSLSEYTDRREKFDKQQKKCKKYSKKENTIPVYSYSYNNNFIMNSKEHKKHKIWEPLKSIFFKKRKSGFIILKPDGNFFFYKYLTQEYVTKFLNEDWEKYINDIEATRTNPKYSNLNFINQMHESQRKKMQDLVNYEVRKRNESKKNSASNILNIPNKTKSRTIITIRHPQTCFTYPTY